MILAPLLQDTACVRVAKPLLSTGCGNSYLMISPRSPPRFKHIIYLSKVWPYPVKVWPNVPPELDKTKDKQTVSLPSFKPIRGFPSQRNGLGGGAVSSGHNLPLWSRSVPRFPFHLGILAPLAACDLMSHVLLGLCTCCSSALREAFPDSSSCRPGPLVVYVYYIKCHPFPASFDIHFCDY